MAHTLPIEIVRNIFDYVPNLDMDIKREFGLIKKLDLSLYKIIESVCWSSYMVYYYNDNKPLNHLYIYKLYNLHKFLDRDTDDGFVRMELYDKNTVTITYIINRVRPLNTIWGSLHHYNQIMSFFITKPLK